METRDYIELGALMIALAMLGVTLHRNWKLNVWKKNNSTQMVDTRINQNSERITVVESKLTIMEQEHKEDIADIKAMIRDNLQTNRDDHSKIFDKLEIMVQTITEIGTTCALRQKQK